MMQLTRRPEFKQKFEGQAASEDAAALIEEAPPKSRTVVTIRAKC